jgi:hypothetical protein
MTSLADKNHGGRLGETNRWHWIAGMTVGNTYGTFGCCDESRLLHQPADKLI